MFARWQIKQKDQMSKDVNESMGYVKVDDYFSSDTSKKNALIDNIDAAARAINSVNTTTYQDSNLTFAISVNDEIAERE